MLKKTQGGFIEILALIFAIIAIGGAFYFVSEKNASSTNESIPLNDASELIGTSTNQEEGTKTPSTQNKTTNPKEVISGSGVTNPSTKSASNPKTDSSTPTNSTSIPPKSTPPKATPAPTPPQTGASSPAPSPIPSSDQVKEPTLFVEAGAHPTPIMLFGSASKVSFASINLSARGGDVAVESLTIERTNVASDRIFSDVGVEDIDFERALDAKHQYETKEAFVIKNGETKQIVIFGNITDQATLSDYEGQKPSLALIGIKTTAKISGTLPIIGTSHTVNSNLTIGSLELANSGMDPGVEKNIDINSTNITFSAVKANASVETVVLKSFAWSQNGTASQLDITNVKTCVLYKSETHCYIAQPNGKYYYSEFVNDIKIDKENSAEIYIKGDILTTGQNKTLDFDIGSSHDVLAYGLTYKNYFYSFGGEADGPQPEGTFAVTGTPFYNGYTHTILGN